MTTQNTSATGGFLVPIVPPADCPVALYDDALIDFYQPFVTGITGLAGPMVRPRWQVVPPTLPAVDINWCAIGVTEMDGDAFAFVGHQSFSVGSPPVAVQRDVLQRQEELQMLCSFYGPNCQGNAALLRDGFSIAQNSEGLQLTNQGVIDVGRMTPSPEKINNLWYRRWDIIVYIRRAVLRTYPVLDLLSAQGSVQSDLPPVTRDFVVSSS